MKGLHARLRFEQRADGSQVWTDDVAELRGSAVQGDREFCARCQARTQTVTLERLDTGFKDRACQCCGGGRPLPQFRRPG